jgi:hypothetical protein
MPVFMEGCVSCAYFSPNPNKNNPNSGQCRRSAPKADPVTNSEGRLTVRTYWPVVCDDWWCGQHKNRH